MIQKNVSSGCIFDNGLILGSVDLISFILSGFISKRFDRYNSQCFQVTFSFILAIGKLIYPKYAIMLSFAVQCSLEF